MTKEKFKELKARAEGIKLKHKSAKYRAWALMGVIDGYEDLTRNEILELMEIVFSSDN